MKKVYITATPSHSKDGENASEAALEALSRLVYFKTADASFGLFGRLRKRDYAAERKQYENKES